MSTHVVTGAQPAYWSASRRRSARTRKLLESRSFRLQQIADLAAHLEDSPSVAHAEVALTILAGACSALQQIDEALARLSSGRFGLCVGCGEQIEGSRLDVLPMVARCMPCQYAVDVRDR